MYDDGNFMSSISVYSSATSKLFDMQTHFTSWNLSSFAHLSYYREVKGTEKWQKKKKS